MLRISSRKRKPQSHAYCLGKLQPDVRDEACHTRLGPAKGPVTSPGIAMPGSGLIIITFVGSCWRRMGSTGALHRVLALQGRAHGKV